MDTLNYRIPDAESALSDAESALEARKNELSELRNLYNTIQLKLNSN